MTESSPSARLSGEARETAGVTTALLLAYLERVGGPETVAAVLARCGLEGCEQALLDENTWVSWETKIALFQAAADVLDDPDFLDEMAAMALDLNVAGALKVALRTLGTPAFVYRNIVRANARFNGSHAMELLDIGNSHARIRFFELDGGRRFHALDCRYNRALLPIVPCLFGLPAAKVHHRQCVADGADACVYELTWTERAASRRQAALLAGGAGVAAGAAALTAPVALPVVGAGALAGAAAVVARELRVRRHRWRHIERQAEDDAHVAQQLFESLQDLVSELDLGELVRKISHNAQRALSGREFAVLVRTPEGLRCRTTTGIPEASVAALEAWANTTPRALEQVLALDDVVVVEALAALPVQSEMPLWSLVSAPLISRGEPFGVLVALGGAQSLFLPRDIEIVQSYAAQAAIALANAHRYGIEQSLAARDPLTGLLNHRSFHEAVERELAECGREQRFSSVVLIDLDGFKRINDEDGHAAGDRFLREAARALADACRHEDRAFRVGGDEFALLLTGVDEHAAGTVAARVCAAIASIDPRTGASCGVAGLCGEVSRDELLQAADSRLYATKRSRTTSRAPHDPHALADTVAALMGMAVEDRDRLRGAVAAALGDRPQVPERAPLP